MTLTRLVTAAVAALSLLVAPAVAASGAMTAAPAGGDGVVAVSPAGGGLAAAPTIQDGDLDFRVIRLAGDDRYGTAARISRRFVAPGTSVVYVASGLNYPDALSAGPGASRTHSPMLFVRKDSVPDATATELTRLQPGRIVVVGGTAAVSETVRTALGAYTAGTVTRLGGTDRYATSVTVSKAAFPAGSGIVYVASGVNWPDALSGGAGAVVQDGPLLLTDDDSLPGVVETEIRRLGPSRIMLVGGPEAVSETVATRLRTIATTERVYGDDRYATALAVSQRVFGPDRPGVMLASGVAFPDALAGVPMADRTRGPIMLARPTSLPYSSELDRLTPGTAYVLGGTAALSIEVPKAAQRERGVCWAGPDYTTGTKQVLSRVSGTDSRKVAFTLDMGGRLTGAADILDFLIANQVCTTFFPTSIMADTTEGRVVMAKITANAHLFEIGNHTVHHCDLVNGGGGSPTAAPCQVPMTSTFIRSELTDAEAKLKSLTGLSTKPYWRPPYGSYNDFVRDNAAAVGYPITVMWNRDTIDWHPDTTEAQIISRTTSPLPDSGSIVLAHLGGYKTGAALDDIVRILRANGYTMTTVSDMRDG